MDTTTVVRITDKSTAPAVWLDGWMPADLDVWPELSEARDDLQRKRASWDAAGERRRELEECVEGETERRKAALRDAYVRGETEPQVQDQTETLKAELAVASERSQAALEAYVGCINRVIALVVEHREEWLASITAFEQDVDREMQALMRQAEALRAKRGNFARLQHWIERTARGAAFPPDHFPYSEIPAPMSSEEEAARLHEFFERSYAGGLSPQRRASAAEARDLEEGVLSAASQEPTRSGEVDLRQVEDEDLTDWILGCGMFDGDPRPSAALVVRAAEGDPVMAERLLAAERLANPEAVRQDVLDQLTEIAKGVSA